MKFEYVHNNINVLDMEKSIAFYEAALDLKPVKTKDAADGSFRIVFLANEWSTHRVELTWLRDRVEPYNLGDNEIHLAFVVDDFEAAHERHKDMGVIVYENHDMGLYFIADPDGYWTEILPKK